MKRKYNKEVQKRSDDKRKDDPLRKQYIKDLQKQPHIIKARMIYNWKVNFKIKCDDFDKLYDLYLSIDKCEDCGCEFKKERGKFMKCLDHDHETGLYRNTVCSVCNWTRRRLPRKTLSDEERLRRVKESAIKSREKNKDKHNLNRKIKYHFKKSMDFLYCINI